MIKYPHNSGFFSFITDNYKHIFNDLGAILQLVTAPPGSTGTIFGQLLPISKLYTKNKRNSREPSVREPVTNPSQKIKSGTRVNRQEHYTLGAYDIPKLRIWERASAHLREATLKEPTVGPSHRFGSGTSTHLSFRKIIADPPIGDCRTGPASIIHDHVQ